MRDEQASTSTVRPQLALRQASSSIDAMPQVSYATYTPSKVAASNSATTAGMPGMPVFVLTTGTVLSVSGFGYQDNRITYTLVGGGSGVISSDEVDWNATTEFNSRRGVRVTLHNSHTNPGTPGF
jgi:hypothetical protein